MKNAYKILYAMNGISDRQIVETKEFLIYGESDKRIEYRKITRTVLIAAVIACLLTITAFAIGYSIHQRRQAEIREEFKIEENNVSGYVEYSENEQEITNSVPAESIDNTPHVQLIASIDNGKYQRIFLSISPVSENVLEGTFRTGNVDSQDYMVAVFASNSPDVETAFEYEARGDEIPFDVEYTYAGAHYTLSEDEELEHQIMYRDPDTNITFPMLAPEYRWQKIHDEAYDSETQSLMIECTIYKGNIDWTKTVYAAVRLLDLNSIKIPLELVFNSDSETVEEWNRTHLPVYLDDYGVAELNAAEANSVIFNLSAKQIEFENPANDGTLKVLSVVVKPTLVEITVSHNDIDEIFNLPEGNDNRFREAFEKQIQWVNFYDELLNNSELVFSNGTAVPLSPSNSVQYEDGNVTLSSSFSSTVDICKVTGIRIMERFIERK